jgi:hypothetical protein
MNRSNRDVRFTPESGHPSAQYKCPLWAKSGHSALRQGTSSFDQFVSASQRRLAAKLVNKDEARRIAAD